MTATVPLDDPTRVTRTSERGFDVYLLACRACPHLPAYRVPNVVHATEWQRAHAAWHRSLGH